jgi:Protein of unknown function (DUF3102)
MTDSSNRLPILAVEIRQAHADVQDAAKTAAERAIEAGHRLIEARALVKHGEWLPWLRTHCALAERTAQLYMLIARKGVDSATVADLGLNAAAKAIVLTYDFYQPLVDGDEGERREWSLYALFLRTEKGTPVWHVGDHLDWIGRHHFKSPYRRQWALTPIDRGEAEWRAYRHRHSNLSLVDIDKELGRLSESDPQLPERKTRRRRL